MEVLPIINVDYSSQRGYEYDPYSESGERSAAVGLLSKRLEAELRAAKHTHLSCGEVLLPCGLLPRIASDILAMAESEPCGLRGCTLYLSFENDQECRKLSIVKCDPTTVSTFELYLTLKQDVTSWHSILPQFLKNLARGGTVMISSAYTLNKKKLYRSYQHTE